MDSDMVSLLLLTCLMHLHVASEKGLAHRSGGRFLTCTFVQVKLRQTPRLGGAIEFRGNECTLCAATQDDNPKTREKHYAVDKLICSTFEILRQRSLAR